MCPHFCLKYRVDYSLKFKENDANRHFQDGGIFRLRICVEMVPFSAKDAQLWTLAAIYSKYVKIFLQMNVLETLWVALWCVQF